jgi:hypothetical protein
MKIEEYINISLPEFNLVDDFKKAFLLEHCCKHPLIKQYIPDFMIPDEFERDFLIAVYCIYN